MELSTHLPARELVPCYTVYRDWEWEIKKIILPVNFILFNLVEFDLILGMDWLGEYKAMIDCQKHKVTLGDAKGKRAYVKGDKHGLGQTIASFIYIGEIQCMGFK